VGEIDVDIFLVPPPTPPRLLLWSLVVLVALRPLHTLLQTPRLSRRRRKEAVGLVDAVTCCLMGPSLGWAISGLDETLLLTRGVPSLLR